MPLHLPTTTRPLVVRRSALSAQSTSIEPLVDVTRTEPSTPMSSMSPDTVPTVTSLPTGTETWSGEDFFLPCTSIVPSSPTSRTASGPMPTSSRSSAETTIVPETACSLTRVAGIGPLSHRAADVQRVVRHVVAGPGRLASPRCGSDGRRLRRTSGSAAARATTRPPSTNASSPPSSRPTTTFLLRRRSPTRSSVATRDRWTSSTMDRSRSSSRRRRTSRASTTRRSSSERACPARTSSTSRCSPRCSPSARASSSPAAASRSTSRTSAASPIARCRPT